MLFRSPMPAAEAELLVLLIRIWAKMPPWRMLLAPRIPQHILGEWRWLETQTTSAAVRDFAGKVGISAVPDLQCVLPDLRHHGDSQGLPPPDTLEACVDDLTRLAAHLGLAPWAIIGHSFGGKVALTWTRRAPAGLQQTWVLDATPERLEPAQAAVATERMLMPVTGLALPQPSRQAAVEAMQEAGVDPPTAQWLGLALRQDPGGG